MSQNSCKTSLGSELTGAEIISFSRKTGQTIKIFWCLVFLLTCLAHANRCFYRVTRLYQNDHVSFTHQLNFALYFKLDSTFFLIPLMDFTQGLQNPDPSRCHQVHESDVTRIHQCFFVERLSLISGVHCPGKCSFSLFLFLPPFPGLFSSSICAVSGEGRVRVELGVAVGVLFVVRCETPDFAVDTSKKVGN